MEVLEWADGHWTKIITWVLIVLTSTTSIWLSRRSSHRSHILALHRTRISRLLSKIEEIERDAVRYWEQGLTHGEPAVSAASHEIVRNLDRLDAELSSLQENSRREWEFEEGLLKFRQAITNGQFQSCPRPPIQANDPRILAISSKAKHLENLVRKAIIKK